MIRKTSQYTGNHAGRRGRKQIWQLRKRYLDSIVGICLGSTVIPQLAGTKLFSSKAASKGELRLRLWLADQISVPCPLSRTVQRLLDNRYKLALQRYAAARSEEDVKRLWSRDIEKDNISGPYWAAMTHCLLSDNTAAEIHAQVTMLSHRELWYRQSFSGVCQDRKSSQEAELPGGPPPPGDLREKIEVLSRDLEDKRDLLALANRAIDELKGENAVLTSEKENLRQEIISLETVLFVKLAAAEKCDGCEDRNTQRCPGPQLCGKTVLYVGGRQKMVPRYRQLVEKYGGRFVHHDGGREVSRALLPKMLGHADLVLCPVDCVSHDACICIKKICKRHRKPFIMMRSSGLSSLAKGLNDALL